MIDELIVCIEAESKAEAAIPSALRTPSIPRMSTLKVATIASSETSSKVGGIDSELLESPSR
jgi:hypothetical protein